ncbi:MAG: 50S ribosomal protein L15 [Puniceicoccales bacterium]|nr:50S ribosomal protein L15 [Puniceicoccales bacterium]
MHEIPASADRRHRRRGRGESSGRGKTAGRGNKGAKARSGYHASPVTSGIPWYRKLPMRGFSRLRPWLRLTQVSLRRLVAVIDEGVVEVDIEFLKARGLLSPASRAYKVIGAMQLPSAISVRANDFSVGARNSIQNSGGEAICVERKTNKKVESMP